jgi:small conductance mechanosensitive channel
MTDVRYTTVGGVILAFVIAAVVAWIANALIHRVLGALDVTPEQRSAMKARAKHLTRALTLLAYGVAALVSISLALERFGVNEPDWNPRFLRHWALTHGVNIVIIFAGAFIVIRTANLAIDQFQYKLSQRHGSADLEWQRRAVTLSGILTSIVTASVGFVAILMFLRELTINVVPILTGAGIVGLAVGFGAQNLVRDVISGFFLILEDQVRIGDSARVNGVAGTVEQINLRTIVVRDGEGAVQVFPNGTITALANLSKQFAFAVVDVRVAYGENIDRVMGTIREVGESMTRDAQWNELILAPLEILGIESLADGVATIRVKFKTRPLNQGKVANELRRRLMSTFVGRRIKPFA